MCVGDRQLHSVTDEYLGLYLPEYYLVEWKCRDQGLSMKNVFPPEGASVMIQHLHALVHYLVSSVELVQAFRRRGGADVYVPPPEFFQVAGV